MFSSFKGKFQNNLKYFAVCNTHGHEKYKSPSHVHFGEVELVAFAF